MITFLRKYVLGSATSFLGGYWIYIVGIVGVGAILYYVYNDWKDTNKRVGELELAVSAYKSTIEQQNKTIISLKDDITNISKTTTDFSIRIDEIRSQTSQLSKIFAKHDLTNLMLQKPSLLEKKINAGTKAELQDLENITNPKYGSAK